MALEDLTGADKFIDDLVVTNPVGSTDTKSTLDDHIRGVKNVLLNTFPNVTGAVTATHTEINKLVGGKPAFSVHRNAVSQTLITGIDKIEWTTEEFDTNSNFDSTTNYRFTPTVAGKYLFYAQLTWDITTMSVGERLNIFLYKNGSLYKQKQETVIYFTSAQDTVSTITVIADANGTSDYFEIFAENENRDNASIIGTVAETYWTGCKID